MADGFVLFGVLVGLGLVLTCTATVYTVGDYSGWDISSDLDSWVKDKVFKVGDVLLFQYSSGQSVNEVTNDNFNGCNVTNAIWTSSNGNTSIALPSPSKRYFICGNKLHCLGGMKLQVTVNEDGAPSPASAPQAPTSVTPSSLWRPNYLKNYPLPTSPASDRLIFGGRDSLVAALLVCVLQLFYLV